MKGTRPWQVTLVCITILWCSGCLFTSKTNLYEAQTQNRILSQQNRAQLTEIENLKSHSRNLEDKLIRSEEELASLKDQATLNHRQLSGYEREQTQLLEQSKTLSHRRAQTPLE